MAETNSGATGGQAQTNTTTSTSAGATGTGGNLSSKVSKTADLQDLPDEKNPARSSFKSGLAASESEESTQTASDMPLPFPHSGLANVEVNASVYRDQIEDVMREHEELLKEGVQDFVPSPEMMAAREDAQRRISVELRATLAAQRVAQGYTERGQTGNTRIKLLRPHTHAGAQYKEGEELLVSQSDADFLVAARVGELV